MYNEIYSYYYLKRVWQMTTKKYLSNKKTAQQTYQCYYGQWPNRQKICTKTIGFN